MLKILCEIFGHKLVDTGETTWTEWDNKDPHRPMAKVDRPRENKVEKCKRCGAIFCYPTGRTLSWTKYKRLQEGI